MVFLKVSNTTIVNYYCVRDLKKTSWSFATQEPPVPLTTSWRTFRKPATSLLHPRATKLYTMDSWQHSTWWTDRRRGLEVESEGWYTWNCCMAGQAIMPGVGCCRAAPCAATAEASWVLGSWGCAGQAPGSCMPIRLQPPPLSYTLEWPTLFLSILKH